ncbi:MAG: GTPase [Clostridia bacterium]|nr:GTPase [Clostridia bacterium]
MSEQEFIPVYMLTGFLESGKTTMIQSMLSDEGFSSGQRTLVICCEDGENEFEADFLKKYHADLVMLSEQEELSSLRLKELNKTYQPERVIFEYNSIWGIEYLSRVRMPPRWEWVQVITLADATTFDNYMVNMRKILTDPMKESDLILINRCGPDFNKSSWRRQLRAMNPTATILFENLDGTTEDGVSDEDLPYDVNAPVIEVSDDQFGTLYLDSMEHPERYDGKLVSLIGQPFPHAQLSRGFYYFGRYAMTCCANDIQKAGWICKGTERPNPNTFIKLKARCHKTTDPDGRDLLTLEEVSAEKAAAPKEKFVSFTNI